MEIPDQKPNIFNVQEKKKIGNSQNFRFEQFLPKRATRSQTEGTQEINTQKRRFINYNYIKSKTSKNSSPSLSKYSQLDKKTRGKKKINYKDLVNQPQQFYDNVSQKSNKSKQESKSDKKQQKKNHENLQSLEANETSDQLTNDKMSSKIKGKGQKYQVSQQNGENIEKVQKKNQLNYGNQTFDTNSKQNGNKKSIFNLEGANSSNHENSNSQVIVQQTSTSNEQPKNKTEPFRSDAPDNLLAIIDNTIQIDQHSILRMNLVAHYIDDIVDPSSLINSKMKKLARIQTYLPFQQDKIYLQKQITLEPMDTNKSKKFKKKKNASCKNKRKNNKKNNSNKKQKLSTLQMQSPSQNDLNEQSSILNQQIDDETSATFTGSQNGEKNLLEKSNDQLINFKSPCKDSIEEEIKENEEIKDFQEIQQNNNNIKDTQNHPNNLNTNKIINTEIQQSANGSYYQNEKNNQNSSNQSLTSNSKYISPKQSQNSNNDDDAMDMEEDDQVADENQEEIDDNNSDEDIFEDYINQFTYEEEIRLIQCSNFSPYYRKLFLDDLQYQHEVKLFNYSKIFESETIPQPQLNCLTQTKITSIDAIRARAENNTYYEFSEFDRDMRKLFNYTLRFRCKSVQSFQYISFLIRNYYDYVKKNNSITQFEMIKKKDVQALLKGDQDNKMQVKKWPIIPTSYRNYEQISDYEPQPPSFAEDIKEKLKSQKAPVKCDKKCGCNSFAKMGEFSLEDTTWKSTCQNRAKRMECIIDCECQNQQISKNERKVIGKDVEETLCWGIDLYTKKNIFYILPERYSDKEKNLFIQFQLMKAINLSKDNGWDMNHCCNFILQCSQSKQQRIEQTNQNTQPKFDEDSRKCAKSIIKAIRYIKQAFLDQKIDPEGLYSESFRIHTKGMGLICINPNGLQRNEFITEYIGEIYQPWRWFEKQDIIKKYMKEQNKRDILPDFWNIMFEIHKDDKKGYDIFFVDPILKGNFSSRLSHSCEPNCGTVPTVTNAGNYVIAMFAMHPIEYGEELSFDYMAVTESMQEHKRAICLCGSSKCRGRYLELYNSNLKQFNSILEKIHCFLNRTYTLYTACNEELNEEDEKTLEQSSFKSNIRNNSPKWLQKWSALVLNVINQEYSLFLEELIENEKKKITKDESSTGLKSEQINLPYLKYLAQSRKDARIQNLVISIDKVKYYTNQINDQSPPLLEMQNDQLLENYWIKTENTLKDDLQDVLQQVHSKAINYQLVDYAKIIISNATKQIQIFQKFGQFAQGLLVVRVVVLIISDFFFQMKNCNIQSDALSLILHFHAFTHKFFKTHSYKKYTSEDQKIQKEDIINVELFDEDQQGKMQEFTPFSDKKTYSSLFVWGQLNMWYKQSVTNPATSLSLERRGPLIYPQLSNSFKEDLNLYPFVDNKPTDNPKQTFMDHLKAKPECYWPGDQFNKWSFRNQMSQFGSFMYESLYYKKEFPNYIEQVVDSHSKSFKEKLDFLKVVETKLSGLNLQEIEDIINSVIEDSPDNYYEAYHGYKKSVKQNLIQVSNIQKSDQIQSSTDVLGQKKRKSQKLQPSQNNFETGQYIDKSDLSTQLQGVQQTVIQGTQNNQPNNNIIQLMQPQMAQQQQQQQTQFQQNILLNQYQQKLNGFLDNQAIKNIQTSQLDQFNSLYQQQQQQQQLQQQQPIQVQQNPNNNDITKVSPPLNPYFNNPQLNSLQNNLIQQQLQQQNPQFLLSYQNSLNQVAQQLVNQNPMLQQQNSQQNQKQFQMSQQAPQLQQQQSQNQQQQQFQSNQTQSQQQQLYQMQNQNPQQIMGQNLQYQQQQQNPLQNPQMQDPLIQNKIYQQSINSQNQTPPQQQQQLGSTNPQLLAPSMQNQQQQQQQYPNSGFMYGQQQLYQNQQFQQMQNNFNPQQNNNQYQNQQQYNPQVAQYQLQVQQNPDFFLNTVQNQQISQQQQQLRPQQQNQQPQNQQQSRSQQHINNSFQVQQNPQSKSQPNIQFQSNYSNTQIPKIQDNQIQIQGMSQILQQSGQSTGGSNGEIHSQKSIQIPISQHTVGAAVSPISSSQINTNNKVIVEEQNFSNTGLFLQQKQDIKLNQQEQQIIANQKQIPAHVLQNQNSQISDSAQNKGHGLMINTGNNYKGVNLYLTNIENDASIQNSKYINQYPRQQMLQQQQSQNAQSQTTIQSINKNNNYGFSYFDDPSNLIKLQNEQNYQNNEDLRNRKSSVMSGNSMFSQKNSSNNQNTYFNQQMVNNSMDAINQAIGHFSPYGINPNPNNLFNQLSLPQNNSFLGQGGYPSNTQNILDDKGQLKNVPLPTLQQPQPQSNQNMVYNTPPLQNNLYALNANEISQSRSYSQQYPQQGYNPMLNIEQERNIPNLKQYQEIQQASNYHKQEIASPSSFLDKNIFSSGQNQQNNQDQQNLFTQSLQQTQQSNLVQRPMQQQQPHPSQFFNYQQHINDVNQQQQHLQQTQNFHQSVQNNAELPSTINPQNTKIVDQNFI